MNIDVLLLIAGWINTIAALIIFIPRKKVREAIFIFLSKQVITWVSGFTVAELGLIVYPVRSFPHAYKGSFDFEFFIYPAICALFSLHYPEGRSRLVQFMYYVYYCTALVIVEVIAERYTNIIKYIHWDWYVSWITFFITFLLLHLWYLWYFKKGKFVV